ncbi:hypothetical protein PR048_028011 [Dryococelus australis]|uniref:C2H2-type domain-containing protein n=1 Tax=Dryococelus australis TaxID=614101 RepID=A0ABQ9GI51_9NEOP|nr:hypothetical protein PR048_028011 [Dryococelus australis]
MKKQGSMVVWHHDCMALKIRVRWTSHGSCRLQDVLDWRSSQRLAQVASGDDKNKMVAIPRSSPHLYFTARPCLECLSPYSLHNYWCHGRVPAASSAWHPFMLSPAKDTRVALNNEVLRADEGEISARIQVRGKREIPEKTRRPAASSSTILTCEDPRVTRPGIEPGYTTAIQYKVLSSVWGGGPWRQPVILDVGENLPGDTYHSSELCCHGAEECRGRRTSAGLQKIWTVTVTARSRRLAPRATRAEGGARGHRQTLRRDRSVCKLCQRQFTWSESLKRHSKTSGTGSLQLQSVPQSAPHTLQLALHASQLARHALQLAPHSPQSASHALQLALHAPHLVPHAQT